MGRVVVLLFCTLMGAGAQTTVPATSGPWTATLDGTWRWHAGDSLPWAAATFDDSQWSPLRVPGPLPPARQYWMWLPIQTGVISDPALLLGPLAFAYDVYWDGQQVGHFGDLSRGQWFIPRWQIFRLPRPLTSPGRHVLALRVGRIGVGFIPRIARLGAGESRIGGWTALHEAGSASLHADFQPRLLQLLVEFGLLLAGLYFLLLPPSLSQGAAFRWLGVILAGRALFVLCEFYVNYGPLNISADVLLALIWPLASLYVIGTVEFAYALFRRPVPLAIRCLECLVAVMAVPVPLSYTALVIRFNSYLVSVIMPIAVAIIEFRKRTVGAGFTLALFTLWSAVTLDVVLAVAYRIPMPTTIHLAGFGIWVWDFALLVWVPAIAVHIHQANLCFRDERERLRREMEAARHVQHLLLPSQSVAVPGFEIEAQYQPATEVGGDFFQLFPASHGSLLVVVGDVSGKGMQAALLVSLVVGVLQNRQSDTPAALLQELNTILLGRSEGGFTTYCCARFAPDGTVTLANAGHVAPYCNGKEIATPPGLPLGLTAEAAWEEQQIHLPSGDRLLWVSDGVIEARNGQQELFGFQRTQEVAGQPASEIARAAQEFGQEDDITVLSITRQKARLGVAAV